MKAAIRTAASNVIGVIALGAVLFLPAGTFNYWQAWVFAATLALTTIVPTIYIARTNPAALRRRVRSGPGAEARTLQKFVIIGWMSSVFAMMAFSAYDHRVGWSHVPARVCVLGDVVAAVGLGLTMLVVIQNGYAAATVTVETGQPVVTTGVYSVVRHPMYVGGLVMMIGIPPALGSYWGLAFILPGVASLVFRILDEETLLAQELAGYREYTRRVRYRLMPGVW